MKIKPLATTDPIIRSLLQKAIRRNCPDLVKKCVSYLILNNDLPWLRNRLAVITFEECWNFGNEIPIEGNAVEILESYLVLSNLVKNKDAAGLGSLAYALSNGDYSVLDGSNLDKDIKIVCEGVKRPTDFWRWIKTLPCDPAQSRYRIIAEKGYRRASWPWDKAFAIAAAYLSIKNIIPPIIAVTTQQTNSEFPIWVGIDKHTPEGKIAISKAAQISGINVMLAMQLSFYFESAKCAYINNSPWWNKELSWKMKSYNITYEEGLSLWEKIKPMVENFLSEDCIKLNHKINDSNFDIIKHEQIRIF